MSEVSLDTIADAVDDAAFDTSVSDVTPDTSTDTVVDTPVEAAPDAAPDPLADPAAAIQDEFEKKWGIPAKSITGRENRIPHSRVKQMVTKAEQEAISRITKELEGKWSGERQPLEAKVKDYEDRLSKVAQFEHVLENDPRTFLGLLSQIPAYKQFFDYVGQLAQQAGSGQAASQPAVPEGMPQPDQALADGTKVYSMEGLQALLKWQSENVEKRVTQQVQQRYAPIEQEWQKQQHVAQMVPVIEQQIAEARQWPNFTELEPQIIQLLKSDPRLSLEKAYIKAFNDVQLPKMAADRNKIRTEVLAELRQKPTHSSAPTGAVRPNPQTTPQNRTLDEVVAQAARDAGLV